VKTEAKITAARKPELFTLYREGVFWSCYNEDAMFFTKYVKAYKVMVKYIKRIHVHVLVVSFPEKVREGLISSCDELSSSLMSSVAEEVPGVLEYTIGGAGTKDGYAEWCAWLIAEKQANDNKKMSVAATGQDAQQKLTDMLCSFDLANSTPMQGMKLIQQMKEILREG
jgi:hypothetical protein